MKLTFKTMAEANAKWRELIKTAPIATCTEGIGCWLVKVPKAHPTTNSLREPWGKPTIPAYLAEKIRRQNEAARQK